MEKRTSAFARIFAVVALAGAVAIVIVVVSSSMGDSDSPRDGRDGGSQAQKDRPRTKAKTYVVKSGDTLVSIARQTGVPLRVILDLNPEVDPQILIAGETLKLR